MYFDLTGFMFGMGRLTKKTYFTDINLNPNFLYDQYFSWVVNYILTTHHQINIVDCQIHNRDEFKAILSNNEVVVVDFFNDSINVRDLSIIRGQNVKTIVNARDLIISREQPLFLPN
jgi:hypothetical protein